MLFSKASKNAKTSTDARDVRLPAMADRFYPGEPDELRKAVEHYLRNAVVSLDRAPKAIISPHAGYAYSGPIAGSAYASIARRRPVGTPGLQRDDIRRVVMIGPSHYAAIPGLGLSGVRAWRTPLGDVPVDAEAREKLLMLPQVQLADGAHGREHCLEVQLPFLQQCLQNFQIVPLIVGLIEDAHVTEVIEALWGGPETLFVISTDLSHYLDYDSACNIDAQTAEEIEQLRPAEISDDQCCGNTGVRAFLWAARKHGLRAIRLDLRNSGDTSGRRDQVVGYGAFGFVGT